MVHHGHQFTRLRSDFELGPLEAEGAGLDGPVAPVALSVTYGETTLVALKRALYAGNTIPRLLSMLNAPTDEGGSGLGITKVRTGGALGESPNGGGHYTGEATQPPNPIPQGCIVVNGAFCVPSTNSTWSKKEFGLQVDAARTGRPIDVRVLVIEGKGADGRALGASSAEMLKLLAEEFCSTVRYARQWHDLAASFESHVLMHFPPLSPRNRSPTQRRPSRLQQQQQYPTCPAPSNFRLMPAAVLPAMPQSFPSHPCPPAACL